MSNDFGKLIRMLRRSKNFTVVSAADTIELLMTENRLVDGKVAELERKMAEDKKMIKGIYNTIAKRKTRMDENPWLGYCAKEEMNWVVALFDKWSKEG